MADAGAKEYRQSRFSPPPGACEIFLVRHGESAPAVMDRPFDLVDGQGDPPLAPDGEDQARRVGERLAGERLDAVYVTTLQRTAQTAAPLVARIGLELLVEADFREVHLGDWEGGEFRHRVAEGDPVAAEMFRTERWDAIPGGEPQADFEARLRAAVERVAAAHPDQRVAVFTHGGVIGCLIRLATGASPFAFVGADNGSISHLVVTPERWVVRCFNDTAHLDARFTVVAEPVT